MAKGKRKLNLRNDPSYQKLLADLKGIIEDAKAKGVELFRRDDLLTCSDCGAYENVEFSGQWRVYDKEERPTNYEEFILIDKKERTYNKNKVCYFKMTYSFICSVCGARQTEVVRDWFDYNKIC